MRRPNGRRRARTFHDEMKRLHCWISEDTRNKLEDMSGQESLGWFVEELVQREYRRRERKMAEAVAAHVVQQRVSAFNPNADLR